MTNKIERPARRKGRTALALVCGLLAGVLVSVGSAAAVRTIVEQPAVANDSSALTARTTSGSLQPRQGLRVTATWSRERSLLNHAQGVITSVDLKSGRLAQPGQAIYHVDERPVVVLSGTIPSYRTLSYGIQGKDAAQLQVFLKTRHLYAGVVDGRLGGASIRALNIWKKSLGLPSNSTLATSEASFVPDLPRELVLDRKAVVVGNTVNSGQAVGFLRTRAPVYTAQLEGEPSSPVKVGLPVSYRVGDAVGRGKITAITATAQGATQLAVHSSTPASGNSVCAAECVSGDISVKAVYPGEVELSPEVSGTIVPVAAIVTNDKGQTVVITADKQSREVDVLAIDEGKAVVRGVASGVRVLIVAG